MIYLDNGATSFDKPQSVSRAMIAALQTCANPGRGGYAAARKAAEVVYNCREEAARMFACDPEQVVFTSNCTHGLNMAIKTLVKPGAKVVVTGFEHNAVVRPLYALGAEVTVAGRKLFDWENTLEEFNRALQKGADAAVFTHVSNVFGYILPVEEMARMCTERGVPFIIDAAQSAGSIPVSLRKLGADFIAMPGHKGLLGPQGTGLLLCSELPNPLLYGGTGSMSQSRQMPDFLPDRAEAGTVNVPGIAGLWAGLRYLNRVGIENIGTREQKCCRECIAQLRKMPVEVFAGPHQGGTVSIRAGMDCERMAELLAKRGIAVRAGLHCAPLAHESAGTLQTGTVRISFGHACNISQVQGVLQALSKVVPGDF